MPSPLTSTSAVVVALALRKPVRRAVRLVRAIRVMLVWGIFFVFEARAHNRSDKEKVYCNCPVPAPHLFKEEQIKQHCCRQSDEQDWKRMLKFAIHLGSFLFCGGRSNLTFIDITFVI